MTPTLDLASELDAVQSPQPLTPGNIDPFNRPKVPNPDGTYSTLRTITIGEGDKTVLLPTIINGRVVSPQEAVQYYRQTGQHLGIFRTEADANAFDRRLHDQIEPGSYDRHQKAQPPKLDLAGELKALTPEQLAVGSRYVSPQTLQQATGATNIPTPPLNFGEQILHVLGSPVTGWGTTAQGQMTDDYRKALDSLTMITGPLAMPMVGGEAMTETILRRGGQLLRGLAQRFGKAPEQVAQDIAQSVQRQPETAAAPQPGTALTPITPKPLDLAGELNAVKTLSPGPTVLDRPQMAMAPPGPSAGPIPSLTIPTELVEPIGKLSLNRRIVGAAQELFTQAGIERTPGTKISDQITDLLGSQKLPIPEMDKTLQRYGLTFTDFANGIFRPAIADAGRRLQTLSALERQINLMAKQSGSSEDLDRLVQISQSLARADSTAAGRSWWQKVDAIRRGLLVTNLSSVVKRTEMGIARVGLNGMQDALDAGLQKAFNLPQTANPLEGLEALGNIVYGGRPAQLNQILAHFPLAKEQLFNEYASEVASGAGGLPLRGADAAFQTAQKAVSVLNVATRAQEHLIRGSVFQANLASRVAAGGDNLVKMIAEGRLGEIPDSAIQGAVQKALETTFGSQPAPGSLGALFIRAVNKMPFFATLAIPFPKHLVSSLKFYWGYSPFGFLKLLMPSEWAAIGAGNTQAISRAVLGIAMLGGAVAFRASPLAGERWNEGRLPDGRTVNLKPFNPFLPYLLVGDMIHRQQTGTLVHPYQTKDVLDAALSVNVSAGTGLLLVDWLVAGMQGEAGQKTISRLQQLAGETLGGFLTPLRQLQDALAEFNPQPRRETRGEPFWGPIKSQIPGLAETLPAAESPTHTGGYVPQNPLVRQLTALGIYQQKNPAEKELDRLQFNRNEIMPSSGDPEADRLIAKHMGVLVERTLVPIVQSPGYQQLSNAQRGVLLQNILGPLHNEARNEAIAENPRLFVQLQLQRLPTRERLLLQEGGVSLPAR